MSSVAVALATQSGPRVVALAIAFVGSLRFIKWAGPFLAERWDARSASIDAREKEVNRRFNARLKHVELELDRYRVATMRLVNALADRDPSNPALTEVARILSKASPIVAPDPELDELAARATDALRGEA